MEILQNGFCMIPNVVLYDTELSDKQKLLYWVISSLCAEKWYCRASNDYIWELLWVNKWTISKNISELEGKWYINISFDSNYKRYIELNSIVENHNVCEKSQGGLWKITRGVCEKSQDININNKNKENIINNNTEQSSEIKNPTQLNSLSLNSLEKEKEKSSDKKEKESLKWITLEINDLIWNLKELCNQYWVAYDNTKDRMFAKHILTAKEFWDFCEKIKQDRVTFACNVLLASIKINYWKWPLAWPMKIYQNYADLYNQTKTKIQKTVTPTIQVI